MNEIKTTKVLGTKLSLISQKELWEQIDIFLNDSRGHYIVTPNPEMVLIAEKDREYQKVLNAADLSIADGFGVVLAGKFKGVKIPRHTGSGLTPELLAKAEKENRKVMVINLRGGKSPAAEIGETLKKRYPRLIFQVADVPKDVRLNSDDEQKILQFGPEIVFLTLGMVVQEKMIAHYIDRWPTARIGINVGGSFDMLTGKAKPAPRFMKKIGMEWFWRLLIDPKRIGRTFRAVVVFMWRVMADRIKEK